MKNLLTFLLTIILTSGVYNSLTVDEFEKAIADTSVVRVDVRSHEEWADGHIAGAMVLDVQKDDFLDKAMKILPKDKTIAVYCRTGRRSKMAAGILSDAGYNVIDLDKGYVGWTEAGKPVVTGPDAEESR